MNRMAEIESMTRYVSPVNPAVFPHLTVVLLGIGIFFTAWFFVYEVTSTKFTRDIFKELLVALVAAIFSGFGVLFLLLWVGIYVWYISIQSIETFDSDTTCKWDCNCYIPFNFLQETKMWAVFFHCQKCLKSNDRATLRENRVKGKHHEFCFDTLIVTSKAFSHIDSICYVVAPCSPKCTKILGSMHNKYVPVCYIYCMNIIT